MKVEILQAPDLSDLRQAIELEQVVFRPYGTEEAPEIVRQRSIVFPQGFVVAKSGDKIVAYASSELWTEIRPPKLSEDPRVSHVPNGKVLCITSMAVHEALRGKGLGTMMLKKLFSIARDHTCHTVILQTSRAIEFYKRNGFKLLNSQKNGNTILDVMTRAIDST